MSLNQDNTVVKVPCCLCGVAIEPNPSNMCIDCLRSNVNFTEEIPNTSSIVYCKHCGRYQTGPTAWLHAELESPELLQICLKRITGLKTMKIVDAQFLYTEQHSRRIRVSLTLQKEAMNNTVLRQTLIVTYVVNLMQCPQCVEAATPRDHWVANVQLRQAVEHKRSLFWLEQKILAQRAHISACSIERKDDGVDFHFPEKGSAIRFINFLKTHIPTKVDESHKLVGEDVQNAVQDMRFSYSVRCPPLSRQDLVILPKHLVQGSGNQSRVAVVHKVSRIIRMVDPMTGIGIDVDGPKYWNKEFLPILNHKSLKRFIVLTIEPFGPKTGRFQIADVEITDEETYSDRLMVRTHLGEMLREGEPCLGYDLRTTIIPDEAMKKLKEVSVSDVIIVGRTQDHKKKKGVRPWQLKQLAPHKSSDAEEFEEFMNDLEDDPELRQDVTIYQNPDAKTKADQLRETTIAVSEMVVEDIGSKYSFTPN